MQKVKKQYLGFIDVLRAFSVLAVIIYHLNPNWLPGGFAGVDVFFVISGYVVTYANLNRFKTLSFKSYTDFLLNRFFRLYPALLTVLLASTVFTVLFTIKAWDTRNMYTVGKYAIWGLGNIALVLNNETYYGVGAEYNPFTHTWSLGVEEQFYLIFPLLLLFILSIRKESLRVLFFGLIILISIGLGFSLTPLESFYLPFTRMWQLLLGGALGYYHLKIPPVKSMKGHKINSFFLLILMMCFIFSSEDFFPTPGGIPVVLAVLSLLHFYQVSVESSIDKIFKNSTLRYIGRISYSLYLWHWPVIVFMKWTVGMEKNIYILIATILTAVLSVFSYHFIENRFRHIYRNRNNRPKWIYGTSVVFSLLCISVIVNNVFVKHYDFSLSTVARNDNLWKGDELIDIDENQRECQKYILGGILYKGITQIKTVTGTDCKTQTQRRLFALGDSHLSRWVPVLKTLARDMNLEVIYYDPSGCPSFTFRHPNHCKRALVFLEYIKENAKAGDIIFTSSLKLERISNHHEILQEKLPNKLTINPIELENAKKEFINFLGHLDSKVQFIIEAPKVIFPSPAFLCQDWFNKMNPVCEMGLTVKRTWIEGFRKPILESMQEVSQQYDNVYLFDTLNFVCEKSNCHAVKDGIPIYFDGDHVTNNFNKKVYPYLLKLLRGTGITNL